MKKRKLDILAKSIFTGALAIMIIFSFDSCARKITFLTSSIVPAARGTVKVKKDRNNNYNIAINLSHLAEPQRLQPSKKTYVVWMVTDQNLIKNIGQIKSSTGRFSKKLSSSFVTVSSIKPIKVFITAEDDGSVQYPGTQVVLSTNSF